MKLPFTKTYGFTQDFEAQLPRLEKMAPSVTFPITDSEVQFLDVLERAKSDGEFRDRIDRYLAIKGLARTAGRELNFNFAAIYRTLTVDPVWVHETLLAGNVDSVIDQMERIQSVKETAMGLGFYALAAQTD